MPDTVPVMDETVVETLDAGTAIKSFLSLIRSAKPISASTERNARHLAPIRPDGYVPKHRSLDWKFASLAREQLKRSKKLMQNERLVYDSLEGAMTSGKWMPILTRDDAHKLFSADPDSESLVFEVKDHDVRSKSSADKRRRSPDSSKKKAKRLMTDEEFKQLLKSGINFLRNHRLFVIDRRYVNMTTTEELLMFWKEVEVLRTCDHENILSYLCHFALTGPDYLVPHYFLLKEYANAGTLDTELYRYPGSVLRESSARFYGLQVCAGVQYLHGLKLRNIGLDGTSIQMKYKTDGSKTCLISSFEKCERVTKSEDRVPDVRKVANLCLWMMGSGGKRSRSKGCSIKFSFGLGDESSADESSDDEDDDLEPEPESLLSKEAESLKKAVTQKASNARRTSTSGSSDSDAKDDESVYLFQNTIKEMIEANPWFKGPVVAPKPMNRVSKNDPRLKLTPESTVTSVSK